MALLVMRAYPQSDVEISESPAYLLDLSPATAAKWLAQVDMTKEMKDSDDTIYSVARWCYHGEFFDMDALDRGADGVEELIDRLYDGEVVTLDPASPVGALFLAAVERSQFDGGARIRTDCDQIEVMDKEVMRTANVKHTSISLESVPIPRDLLESIANGAE